RRDPEGRAQATGKRHCRNQELRCAQRAKEGRKGGVTPLSPSGRGCRAPLGARRVRGPHHTRRYPLTRLPRWRSEVDLSPTGRGEEKDGEVVVCVSSFTASRPSAKPCWKRCSSAETTSLRSTWRRKKKAPKPIRSRKPRSLPSFRSISRPPTRTRKSGKSSGRSSPI